MSALFTLDNGVAWIAQTTVMIAVAGLLPLLMRVRSARWHARYLQILLAACLILPVLQPWQHPTVRMVISSPSTAQSSAPLGKALAANFDWVLLFPYLLVGGIALRASWLLLGIWRLQRYRSAATPLHPTRDAVNLAMRLTHTSAAFGWSDEISGPVTFGWSNPTVLVRPGYDALPQQQQLAIACHELVHVKRRDWSLSVAEEIAGALLWFHPAVWWLLRQIRLAREQAVDFDVVQLTGSRQDYIDALLAMAGERWQLDLAPAPLFLRRRHLMDRIHQLLKETRMSRGRIFASYASITALLAATAWLGFVQFPLRGEPQLATANSAPNTPRADAVLERAEVSRVAEPDRTKLQNTLSQYVGQRFEKILVEKIARDISMVDRDLSFHWSTELNGNVSVEISHDPLPKRAENPAPDFQSNGEKRLRLAQSAVEQKLVSAPAPLYPPLAKLAGTQGVVTVAVLIGKEGNVKGVYSMRGPELLRPAAEAAVSEWVYRPTLLNGEPIEVISTVDVPFRLEQ